MRGYIETLGIILSIYPLREKDRRVVILTTTQGKITATAKGARNLHSPFIGKLQPLNACKLLLYRSGEDKWTITQCELQRSFENIKQDLSKSTHAIEIIESARFLQETDERQEVFQLFLETLERLEHTKKNNMILQSFRIKFLDIMGLLPSLTQCQDCHKKIGFQEEAHWNPSGLLCPDCSNTASKKGIGHYHDRFRKLVEFVKKNPFAEIHKIKMDNGEERTFEEIAENLWNEHVDFNLRAAQVRRHLLV